MRHSIDHPDESGVWEKMTAIKQNILWRWDAAPYAVKVCCIKFVQRVVQVQTPGVISDPRVRITTPRYCIRVYACRIY